MLYDLGLIGPKTPGITWQMDTFQPSIRKQFFDAGFLNNNAVNNIGSNVL